MAKRMTLIPADMLGQMQQMPVLSHLSALDTDMNRILLDKHLSTDVKFKHYQDALQRYHMGLQPPPLPQQPATQPVETESVAAAPKLFPKQQLLVNIPKQKQRSAKMLAEFIENIPELSFTAKNEIRINNETIPNSNIVDLFGDLSRDRQVGPLPYGYRQFTELLNEYNVPLEAIGNRKRCDSIAQRRAEGTPLLERRLSDFEEPFTPHDRQLDEVRRRRRMHPVPIDEEELEGTPRQSKRLQQRNGSRKDYRKLNSGQAWRQL